MARPLLCDIVSFSTLLPLFFSSRRRHTRSLRDWSSDVCSSDLIDGPPQLADEFRIHRDGRGSTRELLDTIAALRSSGPLFDRLNTGALCVTNPKANGRSEERRVGKEWRSGWSVAQ